MTNDFWYQCRLRHDDGGETIAWIEERGAKVGDRPTRVELTTADGDFWEVIEVFQPPMKGEALRQKQANDRNALPSIRPR
jgi:hypothetical protein